MIDVDLIKKAIIQYTNDICELTNSQPRDVLNWVLRNKHKINPGYPFICYTETFKGYEIESDDRGIESYKARDKFELDDDILKLKEVDRACPALISAWLFGDEHDSCKDFDKIVDWFHQEFKFKPKIDRAVQEVIIYFVRQIQEQIDISIEDIWDWVLRNRRKARSYHSGFLCWVELLDGYDIHWMDKEEQKMLGPNDKIICIDPDNDLKENISPASFSRMICDKKFPIDEYTYWILNKMEDDPRWD
jgi:hypothetical protein